VETNRFVRSCPVASTNDGKESTSSHSSRRKKTSEYERVSRAEISCESLAGRSSWHSATVEMDKIVGAYYFIAMLKFLLGVAGGRV
jgi:hypothetical protein